MHTTTLLHITAVKLEVVLPPHPSSDLVLNTLKAGEDTMARVKSSQYDGLEHQGNIQHSHWSSSYNAALSLVESCRVLKYFHALKGPQAPLVLLRQQSYAIQNQFVASKAIY